MTLDLRFTVIYLTLMSVLLGVEVYGVHRAGKGDTITENYRALDRWLGKVAPSARWFLHIAAVGLPAWVALHFAVGWA